MNIQNVKIPGFSVMDFFLKLQAQGVSFLHTAAPDSKENWSILAWAPVAEISSWDEVKRLHLARKKTPQTEVPFCGGGIGTFTFEGKNPKPHFYFYDHFLCFKHDTGDLYTSDPEFVEETWAKPLPNSTQQSQKAPLLALKTVWPKSEYEKAFHTIKEYILDGDIYQINLTQQLTGEFTGDLKALFLTLCATNPSPFAAYLDGGDLQVLSASPERFIALKNGILTTTPVKGTRPRGQTPEEDERLKNELLSSEKEKAELSMITDLLRNDLGQVSTVGSVKVKESRSLQICPTVFHTYSVIEGHARTNLDALDILKACLPGGSISGCPKQRACEIIEELEPMPRGLYTGTLAYLSDDGTMDSSILIRTLLHENGKVSLGVGGGIVADSDCESEYQESLQKASSFLKL